MKTFADTLKIRRSFIFNPHALNDIKIACIGDIHLSKIVGEKDITRIVSVLNNEKPDYICLLGDLIDSPKGLENNKIYNDLLKLVNSCASISTTLIVLGNHDFANIDYEKKEIANKYLKMWDKIKLPTNVHILNDKTYSDGKVLFGGYTQKPEVYCKTKRKRENSEAFCIDLSKKTKLYSNLEEKIPKIFITHSPESLQETKNAKLLSSYDIAITGHYHNGCVPALLDDIFPQNRGIITPNKKLFPKVARGIVRLETGTCLIYSGGWVKIQDCSPKILQPLDKLCNRQMDIIILTSEIIKERIIIKKEKVNLNFVKKNYNDEESSK